MGFYLDYGANINNGQVKLSDLEKTTVYYLSLIKFGGKIFTSDIKTVSSRSLADELRLADVEWANIGFNFVEIGDNNIPVLYNKKTGASLTASDFGDEQYSFGYAYSPITIGEDQIVGVHDTYGDLWTASVTQGFDETTLLPMESNPSAYESNFFALQCSLGTINYYYVEMYPIQASSSSRVAKGKKRSGRKLNFKLKTSGKLSKKI